MDELPLLKLSKNEIHFWQQLAWRRWGWGVGGGGGKSVQNPRVWKKLRFIKQRYRMETRAARAGGATGPQLQQTLADLGFCVTEICNCWETKSSSKQCICTSGRSFYLTSSPTSGQHRAPHKRPKRSAGMKSKLN